jgi:hypothetical protein
MGMEGRQGIEDGNGGKVGGCLSERPGQLRIQVSRETREGPQQAGEEVGDGDNPFSLTTCAKAVFQAN